MIWTPSAPAVRAELAEALVEVETLEGDDLVRLLGSAEGRAVPADEPEPSPPRDDAPGAEAGEDWRPDASSGDELRGSSTGVRTPVSV